jgi:uncharacterized Fe-S center protein
MKRSLPEYIEKVIKEMNPEYTVLMLPCCDDDTLKDMIELLKKYNNKHIKSLDLTKGSISNEGIKLFADMPKQITSVSLCDNNLTEGAASLLMAVFQHVDYLNISDNHLSHEDALYLLAHSPQIWLSVARNRNVTDDDLDNIFVHCAHNEAKKEARMSCVTKLSECAWMRAVGSELKAMRVAMRFELSAPESEAHNEPRVAESDTPCPIISAITEESSQYESEKYMVD